MSIESIGGSIVSKIAELSVEPATRQFRYMFCFNKFVEEFKERKENLVSAKDRLQGAVREAKRNAEEIDKDVKKWLKDANNEIEGAKPLENEIGKNGKCFTWCPNCMRQFKLSKALYKKSETLRKLEENRKKFPTVSHKAPPDPIEFLPSKEFTSSESSKEAFEQIMKVLIDEKVNMIGLCGMGGVGKTTLVKEVGRKAKELQLFDEVLMATLSQNPNVMDIQRRMADSLGLRFQPEVSKEGRAGRLRQRLKTEKKMLIILDDVWKRIELEEIGVTFDDDHRGCKILLTTRLEHVCSSMKCQQKVFLRVLPEDEALVLFRIKSFESCKTISLMGNKLAELPEGLVCPQLKVLLLELDDGLNVPERFFEGMKEIEVLSLKGGCLSLQSLELSTKLQLLLLMECECKDLISLRKLQGLKILGLMSCLSIEELPDEIGELKELRLLDVTGCQRLRRIPVNLIGRLKKLEELLIGQYSFQGWDV